MLSILSDLVLNILRISQWQSIRVYRVSSVCPANSLEKEKMKSLLTFVVEQYFMHWNTEKPIIQNALLAS
jgi:hypothetical protein